MKRKRIDTNAICSSDNYKSSKAAHITMLHRNHTQFTEMLLKEEIVIKKRAYVKVFGKLIAITPMEMEKLSKEITIIWK